MNNLNWPTAFVIVAVIFAGAFVYNKPTGAVLGGSAGMIPGGHQGQSFFQTIDGKVRHCVKELKRSGPTDQPMNVLWRIRCTSYTSG